MKAALFGLVLLPVLAIAILSVRPGGFRRQLRLVRRRFKIALVLGGIYVALSTVARIALRDDATAGYVDGGAAVLLAVTFVVLAQDPARDRP